MNHPDKKKAKSIDMPGRCREFTDAVYSGEGDPRKLWGKMNAAQDAYYPPAPEYSAFIGEMHGHTNFSDGQPDIDGYFKNLRDVAKVDFAAVTDHDHGGVGKPELWVGSPSKWDLIREKVKEYYQPGKFTTILAYERDSYPFYNNMIIYYGSHDGQMIRGERDGEVTERELENILSRKDIFTVPHDTYSLSSGADFSTIDPSLFTPFIEIYSRGDAAEYMGNPANTEPAQCAGGYFRDALMRGGKMGVIAGSDDHSCRNGLITDEPYPRKFPGLTGVWAKENTLDAIFEAFRAKRCYAFMGGRMIIDFRINGHYMGEEFFIDPNDELTVSFDIQADAPVKAVTVVKNCRDYAIFKMNKNLFFDYRHENATDHYYLRVELEDGRFGWTSPIWVNVKK